MHAELPYIIGLAVLENVQSILDAPEPVSWFFCCEVQNLLDVLGLRFTQRSTWGTSDWQNGSPVPASALFDPEALGIVQRV